MEIIKNLKESYSSFINKPSKNVLSSQTLYEALLSNLNIYKFNGDKKYFEEAIKIGDLIVNTQLPNGGFDIGYNFYFGANIKKNSKVQATTPEILSVYALTELYKCINDKKVEQAIIKGINWLKNNLFIDDDGYRVISYAPQTIDYVHITNCISFCIGTIANYASVFNDDSLNDIYHSMCRYMRNELCYLDESKAYWLYFEKKYRGKGEIYSKTDNYHIAQQLYYHSIAKKYIIDADNDIIVNSVGEYLKAELRKKILLPYMVFLDTGRIIDNCDVWGYSSLLLAMLKLDDIDDANKVKKILTDCFWKKDHFAPSISFNYEVLDNNYYPRSDAWVLHALSESLLYVADETTKIIVETGLKRLSDCKYSGMECHALTWRKELGRKIKMCYRQAKNKE